MRVTKKERTRGGGESERETGRRGERKREKREREGKREWEGVIE
jgi:hypothetical protein